MATEIADTGTGADVGQGLREQLDPVPNQQTQDAAENPGLESVLAVAGGKVDVATKAFDEIDPISQISTAAVKFAGGADTGFIDIQNLSTMYLQPFRVFNRVVTTLANVHPYAQVALGILTAVAQLLIRQANIDKGVYTLLDAIRGVYEFLTEDDTIRNMQSLRQTLGKIAQVVSDAAQFITDYSATKKLLEETRKKYIARDSEHHR